MFFDGIWEKWTNCRPNFGYLFQILEKNSKNELIKNYKNPPQGSPAIFAQFLRRENMRPKNRCLAFKKHNKINFKTENILHQLLFLFCMSELITHEIAESLDGEAAGGTGIQPFLQNNQNYKIEKMHEN